MKLTNNFHSTEFASKDGAPMPCGVLVNLMKVAINLQVLSDHINNAPITISSGYRSPEHNARIPGAARNSKHITGEAADIKAKGWTPRNLARKIEELIADKRMHNGGLSVYQTFVHYDVREKPARW